MNFIHYYTGANNIYTFRNIYIIFHYKLIYLINNYKLLIFSKFYKCNDIRILSSMISFYQFLLFLFLKL